ncbi:MAG: DNA-binding protein [Ruminococcaceae bacterium]|nr:DNA-binding protein [Oscillospiraceae bacterium]
MTAVGFDTSNYTTSVAAYDGSGIISRARLLDVPEGTLGLRQSDALFMHVKRLPELAQSLAESLGKKIDAVGASSRPREVEGSYMPCFLAGLSQAKVLSQMMALPFYEFSHQQGHIAAVAYSTGNEELLKKPLLAWHLSGGTTELLLVQPVKNLFACRIIGGTSDISAGQLIDRTGKLLGLNFPAGKALDAMAADVRGFNVKLNGLSFSLSGVENKVMQLKTSGAPNEEIAGFTLSTIVSAVKRTTEAALKQYGDLPVMFTGGVASNSVLRRKISGGIFAEPRFSTDNAFGVAALTYTAYQNGDKHD